MYQFHNHSLSPNMVVIRVMSHQLCPEFIYIYIFVDQRCEWKLQLYLKPLRLRSGLWEGPKSLILTCCIHSTVSFDVCRSHSVLDMSCCSLSSPVNISPCFSKPRAIQPLTTAGKTLTTHKYFT